MSRTSPTSKKRSLDEDGDDEVDFPRKQSRPTPSQILGEKRKEIEQEEEALRKRMRLLESGGGSGGGGKAPRLPYPLPPPVPGIKQPHPNDVRGGRKGGLGKGVPLRHRKVLRDNIMGITKPAVRRLARRAGCIRISGLVYEETRSVLKNFLDGVIRTAIMYTDHAKRKTVTVMDIVYALKKQQGSAAIHLYGYA